MCATCGNSELQRSRYQEAVAEASSSSSSTTTTHHLTRYVARRPSPPPSRPLVLKELSYSFPAPCQCPPPPPPPCPPPCPPPKPTTQFYICREVKPVPVPSTPAIFIQAPTAPKPQPTVNINHEITYKFESH